MRLPSVDQLATSALATLRRFPLVMALAVLATVAGLLGLEVFGDEVWVRLLAVSTLGLPLAFAAATTSERRGWGGLGRGAVYGVVLLVLAALYLAWPTWTEEVAARRYLQLSAGFHLAVAFLPFLDVDEPRGFWQYNRALLLRFLTAAFYVVVLQAGLSLAIGALDQLFGVPVPEETYLRLWIVLGLTFQTWFFLAGVPDDLASLEAIDDYPRGLKLFAQYVLVPLVVTYLLILTAYAVKVVLTWDWPSGWIGWLVSVVAVVGILAYLLVHPVRRAAENRWVRIYGRWFWVALLPAVALLGLAVWQRIAQYGVTEDRYFLAVGTLWLGAMALFYALSRSEAIERIPQTLCVVVLVTVVGPWSAYEVSKNSQLSRLESLLSENGMLREGRARPANAEVSFRDRREISATVRYLVERHGQASLAELFGGELPNGDGVEIRRSRGRPAAGERPDTVVHTVGLPAPERIVASLGVDYVSRWEGSRGERHHTFRARGHASVRSVAGFRHLVRNVSGDRPDTLEVRDGLRVAVETAGVTLLRRGRPPLLLSVHELAERLRAEGYGRRRAVPPERMSVTGTGAGLRGALWLESLHAREPRGSGALEITSWSGALLVGPSEVTDGSEGPDGRSDGSRPAGSTPRDSP